MAATREFCNEGYSPSLYIGGMKTIANRIAEAREAKGLNQSELGRLLGLTPQSVQAWEAGRSSPRGARLEMLAKALGTTVDYLVTGATMQIASLGMAAYSVARDAQTEHPDLEPVSVWDDSTPLDSDEVSVPFLKEVELSAGSGRTAIQQSSRKRLRFGKYSLKNQGVDPDAARCVVVSGNSMEPVLRNGSTVAVDTSNTRIIDGDMYAIDHGGQLRVKQLYRLPGGGLRVRSFNRDEHPDEEYTADQVQEHEIVILGRVFWSGGFH